MINLPTKILKSGIKNLIEKDEISFSKSVSNCLSLKLNDAIKEVNRALNEKFFYNKEETNLTENLKYFVNFVKKYDPKVNNRLYLKNHSYISLSENDFKSLTSLFDNLCVKNRNLMLEEILNSPHQLKQHIDFYNKNKYFFNIKNNLNEVKAPEPTLFSSPQSAGDSDTAIPPINPDDMWASREQMTRMGYPTNWPWPPGGPNSRYWSGSGWIYKQWWHPHWDNSMPVPWSRDLAESIKPDPNQFFGPGLGPKNSPDPNDPQYQPGGRQNELYKKHLEFWATAKSNFESAMQRWQQWNRDRGVIPERRTGVPQSPPSLGPGDYYWQGSDDGWWRDH